MENHAGHSQSFMMKNIPRHSPSLCVLSVPSRNVSPSSWAAGFQFDPNLNECISGMARCVL